MMEDDGKSRIRTIAWNPTGQLIATGSADRTLRIWNPERSQVKYSTELRGHTAGIEKVVFNPVRDSELASCSTDGTVRVWDVRSKTCVSRLDVGGEAFTLSWSADGRVMIVGRKVSKTHTSTKTMRSASGTCQLTKRPISLGRHPHTHLRRIPLHPNHPPRRTTQRCSDATTTEAHLHTINLHSPRTTPSAHPNKRNDLLTSHVHPFLPRPPPLRHDRRRHRQNHLLPVLCHPPHPSRPHFCLPFHLLSTYRSLPRRRGQRRPHLPMGYNGLDLQAYCLEQ